MTDDSWPLVLPHRERLVRIARRRTRSNEDAEDIAQEAMLRVATFPALDPERVGELLTSVTVRLCVDLARRRGVETSALPRMYAPETDALADLMDTAEARFLATVPLTRMERTLLIARVHGLYPSEVAASLGLTIPSAKAALVRARRKIMAAWRATLGVFGLTRLRKWLLPVGGATAVLVATILQRPEVVTMPGSTAPLAWDVAVRDVPSPGRRDVVVQRSPVTAVRPADIAPTAPPASRRPPPVRTFRVRPLDGPVWHEGVAVVVDDREDPVTRVERCLRDGIDVRPRELSVTCRE